jgi:prolyl-tRNA editing enzyme YbaK/EbsC (Cys-tRNA(Pro) deacylase)
MSLESVRAFFAEKAPDITVIESPVSSATVALAAEAYGVEPARIAKTLSLRIGERVVLIVTSGTSRMDNKKVKALFGGKPKMLGLDEVAGVTGHEVGGVCPFGLKVALPVYCDVSLKAFDERWCRRRARSTARCASRPRGWPSWSRPNGSMYVKIAGKAARLYWL